MKDCFYDKLERVFYEFPKYHTKILLGDFNANVGMEDFENQQLGLRVCKKLLMIIELE
jgi:hypothetical protein